MQIKKDFETGINLKDLFFHVLYRWRSILVFALILAAAFGARQYFSLKTTHDAGKLTKEERQYQIDLQNYKENLQSNRNIVQDKTKRLQEQNDYRDGSIFIQLDAQSVWTASNKYLVRIDRSVLDSLPENLSTDPADDVLSAYSAPLSEVTDQETLKEAFGTEKAEYIDELITVNTNLAENTVTVSVVGPSKEAVQNGMSCIDAGMKAVAAGKAQGIYQHELMLASESVSMIPNEILASKQDELAKSMEENQKTLQTARQKVDDMEVKGEPKQPGNHIIKMSVIGFVLGAFILMLLYAARYLTSGWLMSGNDLTERYDIPVFGSFQRSSSIHNNKGLDQLIAKWELKNKETDAQKEYSRIAALLSKHSEIQSILLISTLSADKLEPFMKALAACLPEKTMTVQADFLHNDHAVTEAADADAVIITEERKLSRKQDIEKMAETLIICKAKVIGAIVL